MLTQTAPTHTKFLSKYFLLATLALLLISAVRPLSSTADDVAVFNFSDATFITANGLTNGSNLPATLIVGDITLTFKKAGSLSPGYNSDPGRASLYTKNTLTITSSDKAIKSIEFTTYTDGGSAKLPTETNFSATVGTLDYGTTTCTWSGEASAVTFKNIASGSTRICLQCIKVYTEEQTSTKKAPELKFTSESATTTVDGSIDVTLTGVPTDATVSYTSSATNIATVSTNGIIKPIAPGLVTITATTSSTDAYLQGAAECSLTITPTAATTAAIENLYAKVTSQNDIVEGGIYLVVYEGTDTSYAMGTFDKSSKNKHAAVSVTTSDNKTTTAVNQSDKPYEITVAPTNDSAAGKNAYRLKVSSGKYLYNTGSNKNIEEKSESDVTDNKVKYLYWTITYNTDGTVSISNAYYKNTNNILYKSSSNLFSAYYLDTDTNVQPVTLYRRIGQVSIKTAEGYATLYADCAFTMPSGLQGTTVTGVEGSTLTTQWEYQPGDVVPAYTGVLLKGTCNNTYICPFVDATLENSENCLGGTLINETPSTDATSNFYRLTYANLNGTKTLGFYLWNTEGTPGSNAAGHAYLKLPKTESSTRGFALVGPEATAIHNVETSTAQSQAIYTLSGLRINAASTNALPAGVYIVGGKKVLVR